MPVEVKPEYSFTALGLIWHLADLTRPDLGYWRLASGKKPNVKPCALPGLPLVLVQVSPSPSQASDLAPGTWSY